MEFEHRFSKRWTEICSQKQREILMTHTRRCFAQRMWGNRTGRGNNVLEYLPVVIHLGRTTERMTLPKIYVYICWFYLLFRCSGANPPKDTIVWVLEHYSYLMSFHSFHISLSFIPNQRISRPIFGPPLNKTKSS